ncbi:hypothetical protein EZV62_024782 [Acer yangbiense]|uniref:FACT complex subunit n=1 Tax=Acer yangbiense TaxID=1000413 RepID=A0A5C7GWM9_9ROSI|nr:hypothetical protein EZV62_024782 [Acer yangbiense]
MICKSLLVVFSAANFVTYVFPALPFGLEIKYIISENIVFSSNFRMLNMVPAVTEPKLFWFVFTTSSGRSETFSTRLKTFYSHWKETKSDLWGSADVLAIATPPASEDLRYLKSSALNIWLLGYEFPETIMVFTKKQIHFLCSQKKASLLGVVKKSAMDAVGVDVVLHVKAKTDDRIGLMDGIFSAERSLSKADGNDNPIVGYISRETLEWKLLETWDDRLKNTGFQLSDVTNGLSVKDRDEIMNVKKARYLTYSVMNKIVRSLRM